MRTRLNIIHWVLTIDVIICIIFHRIALSQAATGEVSAMVGSVLQMTIYAALLFFMATCAGIAVFLWQKANSYGEIDQKIEEYPKTSFVAAAIAFVFFTLYWTL